MAGLGRGQAGPPTIGGLRVQTSLYSLPIPIVYGQARIQGNLIHFPEVPMVQSGSKTQHRKAGTGSTSRYFAPVLLALCEGPIAGIGYVWRDKEGFVTYAGNYDVNGWFIRPGAPGQLPWGFLSSYHQDQALSYPLIAYVAHPSLELPNGSIQNFSWEINGLLQVGGGIVDANAKDIITDILTNVDHGLIWPSSKIGDLTAFGTWVKAAGLFLSPAYNQQRPAKDSIQELLQATISDAVWSDGVLKIIPYADSPVTGNGVTYTPNTTPEYDLTDDDFIAPKGEDPVRLIRKPAAEAYNQLTLEFEDRSQNYSPNTVEAKIEADILTTGLRPAPKIQLGPIKDIATARIVAQFLLQRMNGIRNQYVYELGMRYQLLEPMDLVTLTDIGLGLNKAPVRIIEFVELDDEKGFQVTAEEWPFGVATATKYATQGASGSASAQNVDPGNTSTPAIFEGPFPLPDTPLEVWLAASGGPTWGGCDVYVSTDNIEFYQVGQIIGKATYGTLTAALAAGTPLPGVDAVNTLSVDLTASGGALSSGSALDVAALLTLCFVDGEFLSYQNAALVSALHYALTTLGRGAYGCAVPPSHAVGTSFVRCDDKVFHYPFAQGVNGQTLYFKLPAFNIYGHALQDVSTVPSFAHTISGKPNVSDRSVLRISPTEYNGTTANIKTVVGAAVDTIHVHYRTVPIDVVGDPFDFSATSDLGVSIPGSLLILRAPTDGSGVITFSLPTPARGFKIAGRIIPRTGPPQLQDGESVPFEIAAAPPAINGKITPARSGTTASLTVLYAIGPSDGPVTLAVIEDAPGVETTLLTLTNVAGSGTLDPVTYPALANRPLPPGKDLVDWRLHLIDIAGQDWWPADATEGRQPIATGSVAVANYRAVPTFECSFDPDTKSVRITTGSGKTKTFNSAALIASGSPIAFNATDVLDDSTTDPALVVDESRIGYKVDYQDGAGVWTTIWAGVLHGQSSNPPTVKVSAIPNAAAGVESVSLVPDTSVTEQLYLYYRFGNDDTTPQWQLCNSAIDRTARAVTAGTVIGSADYFARTDGSGSPQTILNSIVLGRDQMTRHGTMAKGKDSGVQSAWIPVVLSLLPQPWLESFTAEWDPTNQRIIGRIRGGAFCASVVVIASSASDFSVSPSTQTSALVDGADLIVYVTLSAAQLGKLWYLGATPWNGWTGSAVTGLPGAQQTAQVAVPAAYTAIGTPSESSNQGTLTLVVTDPGSLFKPSAVDGSVTAAVSWHRIQNGVTTIEDSTTKPGSGTTGSYVKTITLDPLHTITLIAIGHFIDGSSATLGTWVFDSNKISDLANSDQAINGANADYTLMWDTDTLVGANCARYSLNGGTTWTTVTVTSGLLSTFSITRIATEQTMLVQAKNALDGNWGNQSTLKVPPYITDVPIFSVQLLANTPNALFDRILWSCTLGTATLSIDGGAFSTPSASPIDVTKPATGRHTYVFKFVNAGTTVTDEVDSLPVSADTITPNLDVALGSPTSTTQPITVTAANPVSGGATPTITVKCVGCTMTISGTTYADGTTQTVSSGTVVTGNRATTTTATMAQLECVATLGNATERIVVSVPPQTAFGPSLQVNATPGSSSYSIAWSGTGTITVSIDGGSFSTPSASPITVTRDGNDHTYTFKAVADSQEIRQTVLVPALGTSGGTTDLNGIYSNLTNTINTYANPGLVDFGWTHSGFGASVVYEVWVRDVGKFGDSKYHLDGTTGTGASSYTYTAGESLSNTISPFVTIGFSLRAKIGTAYGTVSDVCEANYGSP